jgi:succinate dehydrogenase/fumarate reductase flavoprotein subunit
MSLSLLSLSGPDGSFADTKKSARELARDDLIKVLTYKSGDAVNWLVERFNLDLSKVSRLGGHSEKRTHRGGAQFPGMTITYALMEKVSPGSFSFSFHLYPLYFDSG